VFLHRTDLPALEATGPPLAQSVPYLFTWISTRFPLFGSSPEVHGEVRKRVTSVPIAGTRKRAGTREEIALPRISFRTRRSWRAPHAGGPGPHDLGRGLHAGSVEVEESMSSRIFHVMHIVSQVEGILKKENNGIDALARHVPGRHRDRRA